jgi:hypothetical protein
MASRSQGSAVDRGHGLSLEIEQRYERIGGLVQNDADRCAADADIRAPRCAHGSRECRLYARGDIGIFDKRNCCGTGAGKPSASFGIEIGKRVAVYPDVIEIDGSRGIL